MEQLTDGSIIVQQGGQTKQWYRFLPSASGSYAAGTWLNKTLAAMNVSREFFSSDVLPNGDVFVVGGEYSSAGPLTNSAEEFNPYANSSGTGAWIKLAGAPTPKSKLASVPVAVSQFGDDPTALLPNGTILCGYLNGPQTYIYNPANNTWANGPTKLYNDASDEESWVTLPNGNIISYDVFSTPTNSEGGNFTAQMFVPTANNGQGDWEDASKYDQSNPPGLLSDRVSFELGPPTLLANGKVFYTGANGGTGNTAIYDPVKGEWSAGPKIPLGESADDQPGAALPNGHFVFGAFNSKQFNLWEFDPNYQADKVPAYTDITPSNFKFPNASHQYLLVLPTGQLALTNDQNNHLDIYTESGTPAAALLPKITDIFQNASGGGNTLIGTQLNGLSQGAQWGDDNQAFTNFPLVQTMRPSTSSDLFARTSNWSSFGVGAGTTSESVQVGLTNELSSSNDLLVREIGSGVASPTVLYVQMSASASNLSLRIDPGNASMLEILNGSSVLGLANFNSFSSIIVSGAAPANNRLTVDYSAGFFSAPVTFDGSAGTNPQNTLSVIDANGAGARQWRVGSASFTALNTGASSNPTVNFNAVQSVSVTGRSSGNETVLAVNSAHAGIKIPNTTTIHLGPSDIVNIQGTTDSLVVDGTGNNTSDTITVGSLAPSLGGTLANVLAPVTVQNISTLNVDDSGDTVAQSGTISSSSVKGLGLPSTSAINFTTVPATLNVYSGPSATVRVTGTADVTNLHLATRSTVNVQATNGSLAITGNSLLVAAVNVGSLAPSLGGTLGNIAGSITLTNISGPLTVDDSGDATGRTGTLSATAISGFGLPPSLEINYASPISVLTVRGGKGANTDTVTGTSAPTTLYPGNFDASAVNVRATTAALTINGNDLVDNVTVGSLAPSLGGTLSGIAGAVTVTNTSANSTLILDDSADATGRSGTISAKAVTGFGIGASAAVNYTGAQLSSLAVRGGSGGNTETVTGTSTPTTLYAGTLDATAVNVLATTAALTINGNNEVDNIEIGSLAPALGGTLTQIAGLITVTNTSSHSTLSLDDSGDAISRTATLSPTAITGLGMASAAAVDYIGAQLQSLTLRGGKAGATLKETGTSIKPTLIGITVQP